MRGKKLLLLVTLMTFLLGGLPLQAEISPREYALMQLNAPEKLLIEVVECSRSKSFFSRNTSVAITAKVLAVYASATALAEDSLISIRYDIYSPVKGAGWAGPGPLPLLEEGEQYPAFLIWDEEHSCYVPAARGESFSWQIPL